jgi:hypothetical protein
VATNGSLQPNILNASGGSRKKGLPAGNGSWFKFAPRWSRRGPRARRVAIRVSFPLALSESLFLSLAAIRVCEHSLIDWVPTGTECLCSDDLPAVEPCLTSSAHNASGSDRLLTGLSRQDAALWSLLSCRRRGAAPLIRTSLRTQKVRLQTTVSCQQRRDEV